MNNPIRRLLQRSIEVKRLRALSDLKPGSLILEIGCGSGYGTTLIKKHFEPKTIVATDLDPRMIALAQQENAIQGVTYSMSDAANLSFPDKTFDAIVDFAIIHHIPNWKDCLKELYRVLKPGGEIILEDASIETFETLGGKVLRQLLTHPYKQMYRLEEFIQGLKQVGFKEVHIEKYYILGGYAYFALIAKRA